MVLIILAVNQLDSTYSRPGELIKLYGWARGALLPTGIFKSRRSLLRSGTCHFIAGLDSFSYRQNFKLLLKARLLWKKIITVIDATFAVAKRNPEKNQACTRFVPLPFAIPVRRSTNWAIQWPAPSWLVSSIGSESAEPVSQRSRVQISYKPEYFHAFFSQLQRLRL